MAELHTVLHTYVYNIIKIIVKYLNFYKMSTLGAHYYGIRSFAVLQNSSQ